jgi:hypothetical protein
MELTLEGYELSLTVRRRQRKSRREKQLPVRDRSVASCSAEHRLLSATGFSHIVPTK